MFLEGNLWNFSLYKASRYANNENVTFFFPNECSYSFSPLLFQLGFPVVRGMKVVIIGTMPCPTPHRDASNLFPLAMILSIILHDLYYTHVYSLCAYHSAHTEVRRQFAQVISLLPPCRFWESNPGYQACQQTPLPTELSLQLWTVFLTRQIVHICAWAHSIPGRVVLPAFTCCK